MTDEQIDAMPAGPEMDWLVSSIYEVWGNVLPDDTSAPCTIIVIPEEDVREFAPSTDWNDAMFAADGFGLFRRCVLWQGDGEYLWTVWELNGITIGPPLSVGDGPLAICRAILKLYKRK